MVSDELSRPAVPEVAPREPQRRPIYSVVVPVYRNEETLSTVVERLDGLADELDGGLEAVFVVDGSPDASLLLLRRLLSMKRRFSSQLIALSRNFGSFSAVRAGLAAAEGEYLAMMAADLQEPVSLVRDFFRGLADGEHDIAIGVRTARRRRGGRLFGRFTVRRAADFFRFGGDQLRVLAKTMRLTRAQ